MEMTGAKHSPDSASAWSPLRLPVFRALWIASVASSVGTWMHEVADAWLMTTLTPSPLLVALLQSAEALPIFVQRRSAAYSARNAQLAHDQPIDARVIESERDAKMYGAPGGS